VTALRFDDTRDEATRRRLLWAMPAGIYVLGSAGSATGPFNLMTHSLAVQVAVDPCVLAVSIERVARTHGLVESSGAASLCVLRRDQRALVRRFVKPVDDVVVDDGGAPVSMAGVEVAVAPSGAPYLVDAAGCMDLGVIDRVDFTSHTLFCCEVRAVAVAPAVLEGTASARIAEILRMEDTKMNYGG
jgi:flavin reductase (DIM6/NTAB) family NADH-FMN oxidoreductase RutF